VNLIGIDVIGKLDRFYDMLIHLDVSGQENWAAEDRSEEKDLSTSFLYPSN
jgi:hypothetical protein